MEQKPGERRRPECPKCRDPLHERPLKGTGVRVDCCPSCHGMWFEIGELQGYLDTIEGEFVPPANARVSSRRCPACGIPMTAFEYLRTGVEIDLCENCRGVWLDLGEIKGLAERAEESKGGFLGLVGTAVSELKFW